MFDFDGRVIVVTGAGNGLGRSYALEFARRGARVVVNDVGCAIDGSGASSFAAETVTDEILSTGGSAVASCESVASPEGGHAIIAATIAEFGRVDGVVSNAGIIANSPFHEMTIDQITTVISTNLLGAIYIAQPAYRLMKDQGYGRLVFTSSGAGLFGARNEANYAAAKAGLLGLSSTLGIEGAEFGVKSNVVSPSAVTRMAAGVRPEDIGEDVLELMRDYAAVARPSGPEFVTPLVVYLASEACAVSGESFSAVKGRFARAFIGVTSGWYGPAQGPATPEEIERNLENIENRSSYHMPSSVYEELAVVLANAGRDDDIRDADQATGRLAGAPSQAKNARRKP